MRIASRVMERGGLVSVLHPGGWPLWYLEEVQELRAQGRFVLSKLYPCNRAFSVMSGVTFQDSILKPGIPVFLTGPGGLEHRMTHAFRRRYG